MEGAQQPGSIADEESMEGKVRFPLEGGVPIVTTPKAEVGPGVVKQVMRRGRSDKLPTTTSKCFGASSIRLPRSVVRARATSTSLEGDEPHNLVYLPRSALPGVDCVERRRDRQHARGTRGTPDPARSR